MTLFMRVVQRLPNVCNIFVRGYAAGATSPAEHTGSSKELKLTLASPVKVV